MDKENLEIVLNSAFPIVLIETHEEIRALDFLYSISLKMQRAMMVWTAAEGLKNHIFNTASSFKVEGLELQRQGASNMSATLAPEDVLPVIKNTLQNSVVALLDFHPYLSNPKIVRLVKDIAQQGAMKNNVLVLVSHALKVPDELIKLCTRFELSMPTESELKKLVYDEVQVWKMQNADKKFEYDKKAVSLLVQNLMGLTISDAKRLIKNAIYDDGAITHSDIPKVMQAKYQLLDHEGILSYEYDTADFNDIGGFAALKEWLTIRKKFFLEINDNEQMDLPKGILLIGIQGCGKSLAAKAVAGVWGVPLLRLDFGVLYNKYIGETEKNIREALKAAESISPCVLWVDEIEKGVQSDGDDSGTALRVLGTLLTWMAERKGRVFIVATANNIHRLPPELIRKGRLDEIFFVDLPSIEARKEIFKVHLQKRSLGPNDFDIELLAEKSEGYSGAEIEHAVVASRYSAAAQNEKLYTAYIVAEMERTKPLSIVRAEELQAIRDWANSRTVAAH